MTESIYEKNKFTLYAQLFNTFGEMINYSANPIVEEKTKSSQYVELAKQYIKANYFKQITVDELCKLAGVERSYLFRLFKAQTGLSPMEYIIQYKMKKAAVILCENNISISETALAVGYDDKFAFSKMFKKNYGMPPSDYRKTFCK